MSHGSVCSVDGVVCSGVKRLSCFGRGVAQPGRVLRSGRRSRRFESSRPDHHFIVPSGAAGQVCRQVPRNQAALAGSFNGAVDSEAPVSFAGAAQAGSDDGQIPAASCLFVCCLVDLAKGPSDAARPAAAKQRPGSRADGRLRPLRRQPPTQRKPAGQRQILLLPGPPARGRADPTVIRRSEDGGA